jgi:2-hydroxychromene-2-carboxylate isomerase
MPESRTPEPIDFYYDFSSSYGYFAAVQIDELAARFSRTVRWRPYVMGAVMKITGAKPLVQVPMMADYSRRDIERCARMIGAPFRFPEPFPILSVPASRAYYWLEPQDATGARRFALAAFHAYFAEGRDISEPGVVVEVAAGLGIGRQAAAAGLQDPAVKDRLKRETDLAQARGVFGSPFVIVDGEPFWGHDRLPHVARWLETGGW